MKTIAIVPMKALAEAKTRLAGALSPEKRAALAHEMLHHVLDAVTRSGVVDTVAVVGPTAEALDLPPNVVYIKQAREGLNHALGQGKEWAIAQGADVFMVVLADLPLLTPDDITGIVRLGSESNTVVLAPDRHNAGTNIMLAHPASLARFAFGIESYPKHVSLHQEVGARVETYLSLNTALDLDTQNDLQLLRTEPLEAFWWPQFIGEPTSDKQRGWWVISTYSGYENKVKKTLEHRIATLNMGDHIFRVEVPTVQEAEIKGGQRQLVQRKVLPGYVLVEMIMDDKSRQVVRNTPGVTDIAGFYRWSSA